MCHSKVYTKTLCGREGVGVLSPVGDNILQEFNTLYLTRFRTYKPQKSPPQTKTYEGRDVGQINAFLKVPLQVNIFRRRHFALVSLYLISRCPRRSSLLSPYFYMFMGPRNWFQGINSASLCSLAGRYDKPIPPWFLAPIDFLKIPALFYSFFVHFIRWSYFPAIHAFTFMKKR